MAALPLEPRLQDTTRSRPGRDRQADVNSLRAAEKGRSCPCPWMFSPCVHFPWMCVFPPALTGPPQSRARLLLKCRFEALASLCSPGGSLALTCCLTLPLFLSKTVPLRGRGSTDPLHPLGALAWCIFFGKKKKGRVPAVAQQVRIQR